MTNLFRMKTALLALIVASSISVFAGPPAITSVSVTQSDMEKSDKDWLPEGVSIHCGEVRFDGDETAKKICPAVCQAYDSGSEYAGTWAHHGATINGCETKTAMCDCKR